MHQVFAPPRTGFWVFAYGSLMWSPGFRFAERRHARLHGFHRSLCIYSWVYRGTRDKPGLVFGLERGGITQGMAYRVRAREAKLVYEYLYEREMPTAVYHPVWGDCALTDGRKRRVRALCFVADPRNPQYAGGCSDSDMHRHVSEGRGDAGTCTDYVLNTLNHLRQMGIRDRGLERLAARLI